MNLAKLILPSVFITSLCPAAGGTRGSTELLALIGKELVTAQMQVKSDVALFDGQDTALQDSLTNYIVQADNALGSNKATEQQKWAVQNAALLFKQYPLYKWEAAPSDTDHASAEFKGVKFRVEGKKLYVNFNHFDYLGQRHTKTRIVAEALAFFMSTQCSPDNSIDVHALATDIENTLTHSTEGI